LFELALASVAVLCADNHCTGHKRYNNLSCEIQTPYVGDADYIWFRSIDSWFINTYHRSK